MAVFFRCNSFSPKRTFSAIFSTRPILPDVSSPEFIYNSRPGNMPLHGFRPFPAWQQTDSIMHVTDCHSGSNWGTGWRNYGILFIQLWLHRFLCLVLMMVALNTKWRNERRLSAYYHLRGNFVLSKSAVLLPIYRDTGLHSDYDFSR